MEAGWELAASDMQPRPYHILVPYWRKRVATARSVICIESELNVHVWSLLQLQTKNTVFTGSVKTYKHLAYKLMAESLLINIASRITHLLCMTHTMQLVQRTSGCDKSNTLCNPAQSAPQADGSSMPSLVSLPDTALDAILHQLGCISTIRLACHARTNECKTTRLKVWQKRPSWTPPHCHLSCTQAETKEMHTLKVKVLNGERPLGYKSGMTTPIDRVQAMPCLAYKQQTG